MTDKSLLKIGMSLLSNYHIIIGCMCYGISILLWIYILKKNPISYAYPFLSLGFIFTTGIGYFYFHDEITLKQLLGISCIILGVILIYGSK